MPWVHLHIDTNGLVKACCDANITLGNIHEKTITEIWNDKPIQAFRKSLLAGQRDKRCMSCYRKEDAGKSSMRTETLEKFNEKLAWASETSALGESTASPPVYFDIRFNNLCNLRCRTCWHGASSSWFEEAKILGNNVGSNAIISASKDNLGLIDQLMEATIGIEEIYFAGGEPLMMAEHYVLLDKLLASDQYEVRLRYNTNLSNFQLRDKNVLDYWRRFRNVTVSASIDGLGHQAEYIRKGLSWDKFVHNMEILAGGLPHINLEIAPTISVFNILNLADLHRYFVDRGLISVNAIYLNILSRPDYYNIKILPANLKRAVEQSLNAHLKWLHQKNANEQVISEFKGVIKYMTQEDWSSKIAALRHHIDTLDRMRSENFQEIFPVLSSVLDPA